MIARTAATVAIFSCSAVPTAAPAAPALVRAHAGSEASDTRQPVASPAGIRRFTLTLDGAPAEVTLIAAGPPGLLVEPAGKPGVVTRRILVSWDRIDPEVAARLASEDQTRAPWAAELWRARARLERGDWPGAEPIIETAMTALESAPLASAHGGVGPSHALVARAALTCRLNRGAQASALRAYFLWLRAVADAPAGVPAASAAWSSPQPATADWLGGDIDLPGILDDRWGLCPNLPPIFVADPAIVALARQPLPNLDATIAVPQEASSGAAELIEWYLVAARFEAGVAPPPAAPSAAPAGRAPDASGAPRPSTPADVVRGRAGSERTPATPAAGAESLRLVRDIVLARTAVGADRLAARASLNARIDRDDTPAWVEAWCRAGLGRSLVGESDESLARAGVVELLHVPARFARQTPHLAAVCLAEAAAAMERLGDAESSRLIRAELVRRYPTHPAVNWIGAVAAGSAGTGVAGDGQRGGRP